jgi:hypothetical protein
MDVALLQLWLNLPAGPWPPEPSLLLGQPRTQSEAEAATVERMEILRPHQLMHPELVTEGMNRLAQALLHYGDAPVVAVDVEDDPTESDAVPFEAAAPVAARAVPVARQAEPPQLVMLEPLEPQAPPPGLIFAPPDRRKAYRELVQLRRLRAEWETIGPLVGNPKEGFLTAESVYLMLVTKRQLQTLMSNHPVGDQVLQPDCTIVLNLLNSMNPATTVRDLVPSQRERVARIWNVGRVKIDQCYWALRESLRRSTPRHPWARHWHGFVSAFRENPEWILIVFAGLVVMVAVIRWASAPKADRSQPAPTQVSPQQR